MTTLAAFSELFPLVTWFTFGSILFWIVAIIGSLIILSDIAYTFSDNYYYEYRRNNTIRGYVSVMLLFLFMLMITDTKEIFGDGGLWAFIVLNPLHALLYVGFYLLIGAFWGLFQWWVFAKKVSNRYDESKADFLSVNNADPAGAIPDNLKEKFLALVDIHSRSTNGPNAPKYSVRPYAKFHKGKITKWMSLWPWSAFWWILGDLISEVYAFIQRGLSGILDAISKRMFKKSEAEVEGILKTHKKED